MNFSKPALLSLTMSFILSTTAYAGGVHCKECPAESNACMPMPNCAADRLPYSDTLSCIQEGLPQVRFTVEENKPEVGQARLTSATGQPQTLQFTETIKNISTRLGPVQRIQKTYFHPYYQYDLFAEVKSSGTIEPVKRPKVYTGSFQSEMNKGKAVSCNLLTRKKN